MSSLLWAEKPVATWADHAASIMSKTTILKPLRLKIDWLTRVSFF
jgi:hypothetical protein